MNKAFVSVLKDYLKSEKTDYALMIKGVWGSGKTFFINNTLKSEVEKIACLKQKCTKDGNELYKLIYVSLYGVSSIDEIKERIFYSINSKYKWIEFISNKVVSVIEEVPVLGKLSKISQEEKESIRETIAKYDDKIFFFDDLERIDTNKIDIQSVLGYINSLTEHTNYKVVVVANDDVLGDDYKQFKEKTIRFSYNHCPDMSDIYDSICNKYKENSEYITFLKEQKQFILNVVQAGECKNIRTLIFITDVYKKIFEITNGGYSKEINQDLLLPFTIISIEAKNGHTKEELKDALQSINDFSLSELISPQDQNTDTQIDSKEEYEKKLKNKYERFKDNRTIRFYDELYDLVYDGYVPQENLNIIIKTIRDEYIAKVETEEIILAKRIFDWPQIPDDEFNGVVEEVNKKVLEYKYKVFDLLKIYGAYIQIEAMEIENFKVDDNLTNSFKSAIDAAMRDQLYFPFFDIKAPLWDDYDRTRAKEKYNELRRYAFSINQRHKEESTQSKKQDILNMIHSNDAEQFRNFISDYNNKLLFVEIPPEDIINAIVSANAETKQVFFYGLHSFFPKNSPSASDLEFLTSIKKGLDAYLNRQTTRRISLAYLYRTQKYIDETISQYKKILNIL